MNLYWLAALMSLLPCIAGAQQPAVYDAAADFSLTKNPNGPWEFGYSASTSLNPGEFRLDKYCDGGKPVGFWHPEEVTKPGPGYYPYVAFNREGTTVYGSSNGWAVRADEIAMEASLSGQYSIVRF